MAEFTAALTKPNGLVPQFGDNDSARVHKLRPRVDDDVRDHRHLLALVGELVDREDLRAIGANAADEASVIAGGLRGIVKPPTPNIDFKRNVVLFPISGVAVLRRAGAYVAITCGPNGQGGRGGHGHNDKNSFELNIDGLDVIVDGGCPVYSAAVDIRNLFRSTAAHNTISVDGEEQDSWEPGVRGLFRLPQRSAPELSIDSDTAVVGRHSGFGSVHERRFVLESNKLVIDDRLEHPGTKYVNFNLDPGISVERLVIANGEIGCDLVHITGRRIHLKVIGATEPKVSEGCFSLGYGVRVKNNKLSARLAETTSRTEFSWTE
jgi:hypothetical protein